MNIYVPKKLKQKMEGTRTTTNIDGSLRARMDASHDRVNWSAVACRAFEEKLLELASATPLGVMASPERIAISDGIRAIVSSFVVMGR